MDSTSMAGDAEVRLYPDPHLPMLIDEYLPRIRHWQAEMQRSFDALKAMGPDMEEAAKGNAYVAETLEIAANLLERALPAAKASLAASEHPAPVGSVCAGCEGAPALENNPCAVCGRSTPAPVGSGDGLRERIDAGLRAFCSSTPDFDMSSAMRRAAADFILGQPALSTPSEPIAGERDHIASAGKPIAGEREALERAAKVAALIETGDYLVSLYSRLWKGGVVRDLDEAECAYASAKADALATTSKGPRP